MRFKWIVTIFTLIALFFPIQADAAKKSRKKAKPPPAPITEVRVFVPEGADLRAKNARVVIYFFGWDTGVASGFVGKSEQVFEQFRGLNVAVFVPNIGSQPGRNGINLPDLLQKEYSAFRERTGVDLSELPVVAIGFSGGAYFLSAYLRHGYQRDQLNKGGSVILYLGGLYHFDISLATKYSAAFVSISCDGDVPTANKALAASLGIPVHSSIDDIVRIEPREAVVVNVPLSDIHNTMPQSGFIREVMELTAQE